MFSTLDRHFAKRLQREAAQGSMLIGHAAALVSSMLRRGHICIDLRQPPELGEELAPLFESWPSLAEWRDDLEASGVVGEAVEAFRPLVLDAEGRLYLHRYFAYEHALAAAIGDRVSGGRFRVIVGGPGTGKTTRILDLLSELVGQDPTPVIALAAPTGKAAKRMEESIRAGIDGLALDPIRRERIPRTASTLHRLLGTRRDSAFFKHDRNRPLMADVVIIDEASMVDLPLMAKLLDALKPSATLVLVGDPDQLASVEAGAVLSDIATAAIEAPVDDSPLRACLQILTRQHRYGAESGIGRLCTAIRTGDADEALSLLMDEKFSDIRLRRPPSRDSLSVELVRSPVVTGLLDALSSGAPNEILEAMSRQRVLCATRIGPYGVESINVLVEALAAEAGRSDMRPVVLTRNDHALRLFNGDAGVIVRDARSGDASAWFQDPEGGLRSVPSIRLPAIETAYAMTVHRSQGSEFDRVLIVLPTNPMPILTRELLYTAISRARRDVEIWATPEMLKEACRKRVRRHSGLASRLR